MQPILFIGADFEQFLRIKTILNDFTCVYSVNLSDGIRQFNQQRFSLIVLDLSLILSDVDQEELLRSFRRAHPVPIIALCENAEDSNVVRLLGAGADQVLDIKTADTVLTAYAQTLVNRYTLLDHMDREQDCRTELCVGDFKIDLMRRQVFLKEEKIELSGKEFDLLLFFAQNPNRVLTEAQIYDRVWHTDKGFHSSIAKPINRLRQKIEPDQRNPVYIQSIRGVGYQFVPNIVTSCDI